MAGKAKQIEKIIEHTVKWLNKFFYSRIFVLYFVQLNSNQTYQLQVLCYLTSNSHDSFTRKCLDAGEEN